MHAPLESGLAGTSLRHLGGNVREKLVDAAATTDRTGANRS